MMDKTIFFFKYKCSNNKRKKLQKYSANSTGLREQVISQLCFQLYYSYLAFGKK